MDDFNLNTIQESRAEWCEQFIMIVRPTILEGFDELFKEANKLCRDRQQPDKYLITFQNMICQISKWSQAIVEKETKRIIEKSHCSYLEVLLSTTHIAQLKILSAIRAGQKPKQIDMDIPILSDFIHNIYINVGRLLYKNAYLYIVSTPKYPVSGLDVAKNRRQIENLVKEGILETFRKKIPIDKIIKAYLEPTEEEIILVKTEEEYVYSNPATTADASPPSTIEQTTAAAVAATVATTAAEPPVTQVPLETTTTNPLYDFPSELQSMEHNSLEQQQQPELSFNNIDSVMDGAENLSNVEAPKTLERLDDIRKMREQYIGPNVPEMDDQESMPLQFSEADNDVTITDLYDDVL